MSQPLPKMKIPTGDTANPVAQPMADIPARGAGAGQGSGSFQSRSFAEKNRLFAEAGRAVISCLVHGKVEIQDNDVQLQPTAANCAAILIDERVSGNPEFQKMWAETSCQDILKTLAQWVLQE